MAIPVWPTSLPQPLLRKGYQGGFPNNLLISEGESGAGKVRPKGATPPFPLTVAVRLTTAQLLILQTFVQDTLKDGSLRFELEHPVHETLVEVRLLPVSGDKLYSETPDDLEFIVTMNMVVLP